MSRSGEGYQDAIAISHFLEFRLWHLKSQISHQHDNPQTEGTSDTSSQRCHCRKCFFRVILRSNLCDRSSL
ncbi:hypothetical protein [Microcoleus sp. bin38.metabat.b11b12b14.051]|uniref:hypothetical protein n=1 Tax=Microcoleus sp. bin38.metabat.b11b12b14.051 TaxID=2742709 RepID=UPI0025DEE343|nr:hypothetical protein [Microcoleus sp. bin38.metabat.b11b12b14.051]